MDQQTNSRRSLATSRKAAHMLRPTLLAMRKLNALFVQIKYAIHPREVLPRRSIDLCEFFARFICDRFLWRAATRRAFCLCPLSHLNTFRKFLLPILKPQTLINSNTIIVCITVTFCTTDCANFRLFTI